MHEVQNEITGYLNAVEGDRGNSLRADVDLDILARTVAAMPVARFLATYERLKGI